jgi:hypothetical protein
MAELTRLELATFRVTGGRSNQLSYSSNNKRFETCHFFFTELLCWIKNFLKKMPYEALAKHGSSGWIRTSDLTINSRVLYH